MVQGFEEFQGLRLLPDLDADGSLPEGGTIVSRGKKSLTRILKAHPFDSGKGEDDAVEAQGLHLPDPCIYISPDGHDYYSLIEVEYLRLPSKTVRPYSRTLPGSAEWEGEG